jgi:hypothetical protein
VAVFDVWELFWATYGCGLLETTDCKLGRNSKENFGQFFQSQLDQKILSISAIHQYLSDFI